MSEPESLDTDEPVGQRIQRHDFDRLIMLSDGVFAIAMTLLALEVRPPAGWQSGVIDLLARSGRSLFGYFLSFLIVALFWSANRSIMARVRRVDGPFTALALLFLCLICLTPFATALMAEHGPTRTMAVYSLLVGIIAVVQAILWSYAAFWRPLLIEDIPRRERWLILAGFLLLPLAFSLPGLMIRPGSSALSFLPIVVAVAVLGRLRRWAMRTRGPGASPR